jgi:hypothetical protein
LGTTVLLSKHTHPVWKVFSLDTPAVIELQSLFFIFHLFLSKKMTNTGKKFEKQVENTDAVVVKSEFGRLVQDNRWYQLYRSKTFTDFELVCKDTKFSVHKCVLISSASQYFKTLFDSDWKETESGVITIPDGISVDVLDSFIIYLYTSFIESSQAIHPLMELYKL